MKSHFEVIHFDSFEKTATVSINEEKIDLFIEIDDIDEAIIDVSADGEKDSIIQDHYQSLIDLLQDIYSDHISSCGSFIHLRF